jgi:2-polyprenyl-6-methoxyphenol hydroxylase-like FAD-dependent oxidoreductase
LNTLLLDAAESTGRVSIRFGETVCGVDFTDRQVRFVAGEDPERQTQAQATPYDVLIGTDGSASAVRASILERAGGRLDEEPLDYSYKALYSIFQDRPPNVACGIEGHVLAAASDFVEQSA